jgi:hypothetical protein
MVNFICPSGIGSLQVCLLKNELCFRIIMFRVLFWAKFVCQVAVRSST